MKRDFLETEEYKNYVPKTPKRAFKMYYDLTKDFDYLTDEELGALIRAVYEYAVNGTCTLAEKLTERVQSALFRRIKTNIDLDNEKYKETCYINSLRRKAKDKKKAIISSEIEVYEK